MPTSYQRSASQVANYINTPNRFDLAPDFELRDQDGRQISNTDDFLSGKFQVLLFANHLKPEALLDLTQGLKSNIHRYDSKRINFLIISSNSCASENKIWKSEFQVPFLIAGDPGGTVFAKYGIHMLDAPALKVVLISPLKQIMSIFEPNQNIEEVMMSIDNSLNYAPPKEDTKWFSSHAPILMIPNVLSCEECRQLIEYFEKNQNYKVAKLHQSEMGQDFQMPIYEHDRQDRIDQIINDKNVKEFLDKRIHERVNPLIMKAFSFSVTRREDLHIARYTGKRLGIEMGHRDNTGFRTAYRRFAFSMNLNSDYQGGEIVFNEFSPNGYKGDPGTVLIFSSSLLHEVTETTEGTRYTLITHLFNEQTMTSAP